jgi:hypothetical protein
MLEKDTYRTILPWMAQETQYWSFRYILGTVYSGKTEASEMSPAWPVSFHVLGCTVLAAPEEAKTRAFANGQSSQRAAGERTYGWQRTQPCCGW